LDAGTTSIGCVDQSGHLHAAATSRYTTGGSWTGTFDNAFFAGNATSSVGLGDFEQQVAGAVTSRVPSYSVVDSHEGADATNGCVLSRTVRMVAGDAYVIANVWRLESQGDLETFAREDAPFSFADETTAVSPGHHLTIVLDVAQNGTTVRVAAYGDHALGVIAGWPTTITVDPSAGPPTLSVEDLTTMAHAILDEVTKGQQ
jgi:hypothetical protein